MLRLYFYVMVSNKGLGKGFVMFICFINFVNMLFSVKIETDMWGRRVHKFQEMSDALVKRRKAFLDEATVSSEITAFQILNDFAAWRQSLGLSSQLSDTGRWFLIDFWVTDPRAVIEHDAKIREIPYGINSRFIPEKGCLVGTRVAFLDFITNWVNDPTSERCLILFGQAGMGKSSIAHEIARRFDKLHRLTSSFVFRRELSERKAPSHHLFTTLARDLADRYPEFKTTLRHVIKNNTAFPVGARDYDTLFESLILEPLSYLKIAGPILVVIDALDESGDTIGKTGLHAFLAENLKRLPSNFRVIITSRPEHPIISALAGAPSVRVKYMNDTELAAETHTDILTFLLAKLPKDKFGGYVEALAVKAEESFQWAAVASQLILDPPERFAYIRKMTRFLA